MKRAGVVTGALVVAALLVVGMWWSVSPPVVGQASVPCYMMQGGAKQVAGDGCEWEMQDGATLEVQDGVTASIYDLTINDDATVGGDLTVTGSIVAAAYVTTGGDVDIDAGLTATDLTADDDLVVGDDATITGTLTVISTSDLQGNIADSGGALTVADNVVIDGAADVVQLTVQGNATQTSNPNLFVVENSGGTDQFTVNATGTAAVTGDLTVGDDLTVTDDATVNDLTVTDMFEILPQEELVLTDNALITPTGSLQPISAAGAIGIDGGTNIAHTVNYLILVNIGAETITFTETTGLISAGNVALGAGDASTWVWADSGWIEIARSNN